MSAPWPYSSSSAPFPAAGTSQVSLPDETADGSKKRKRQSDSQDSPYYQLGNPEASQGKGKQRAIDQHNLESTQASQQPQGVTTASYTNDINVEEDPDVDDELEEGEISEDEAGEAEAIADLIVAPKLKPTSKTQATVALSVPPPAKLSQTSQDAQLQPFPSQSKNPLGNPPISSQGQPSPSISRSHTALQSQQAVASSKLANKPIHPPFDLQSGMTQDVMNDCITLIEQLYSWGMTVDYMLGQGLEKDLVLHVFVERGFKLPPHHLQYYQEKLSGQALGKSAIPSGPRRQTKVSPSYPRPDHTGSIAPPRGPSAYQVPTAPSQPRPLRPTAAPQHGPMSAPTGVDLSEKEAKARNALLARKAKIAKKNAEKAQDFMAMEAQLSDLLAGIANDNAITSLEENRDSSGDDMQIDSDDSAEASAIEAKAEGAAASRTPAEAIVAGKQVPAEVSAGQPSGKQSVSNPRRPVASDFESEPVQSLPNVPRWSAHLAPSTRFNDMVISLSDDESEDDSDTEQLRSVLKETKKQETNGKSPAYPVQTALPPVSRKPSPILAAPPPLSAKQATASPVIAKAEAPQSDAKAQLEAKQAEIKRMMEVISKLEQKKKTTGSKTASRSGTPSSIPASTPTAASDKPNPLEAHMKASAEKKHLRQAIETVEQLLEEKQELVEQVEESQQAIAEDMQVEQMTAVEEIQEAVESVEDAQMETEPQEPQRADSLEPYDDGHESSDDDAMLIITSNMQTDAAMTKEDLMSLPEEQDNKAQSLDLLEQTQIKHVPILDEARELQEGDTPDKQEDQDIAMTSLPSASDAQPTPALAPMAVATSAISLPKYVSYRSPFDVYPLCRQRPISRSEIDSISSSSRVTTDAPRLDGDIIYPQTCEGILMHHIRAWLTSKKRRHLDVLNGKYCRYEMLGTCNDDDCKDLHVSSFTPTVDDAVTFIHDTLQLPSSTKPARLELYKRGLDLIIERNIQSFASTSSTSISSSSSDSDQTASSSSGKAKMIARLLREAFAFYDAESSRLQF